MKTLLLSLALLIGCSSIILAQGNEQQQIDSIQREVLLVLNEVRNNPTSFIPAIERYRTQVRSFTKSVKALDAAVKEIIAELKKTRPLPLLNMQGALQSAAEDHASDITTHNVLGHIGSDGSDPLKRVNTYGQVGSLGEAITYGHMTPDLIIASFLVDEGTPGRGHRKNLLNPTYTLVGIAIGTHSTYGRACVIVLGAPL